MNSSRREESEVFHDLKTLCTKPGYIHVLAYLCARDNLVAYDETLTSEDFKRVFSSDRLIRNEISTLLGLLITAEIDFTQPRPDVFQRLADETDSLLEELHSCLTAPMLDGVKEMVRDGPHTDFLSQGSVLREPIFYSGESAYSFQYRDLARKKYLKDEQWLEAQRGFTIEQAIGVAKAISILQTERLARLREALFSVHPDEWTLLPAFSFQILEIAKTAGESDAITRKVLEGFTVPNDERNAGFCALDDFNVTNATPMLRIDEDSFILFQIYTLCEAIYDSPFFWMLGDKSYKDVALSHRGDFTETFSTECLSRVFGKEHVFPNVTIPQDRKTTAGEIDVLVLFGNRAMVLQAKSKRLTIAARKGNDGVIKDDFKKSIQNSYDQAKECAELLSNREHRFIDAVGNEIKIPKLRKIYLLCVVSDHYPALSFQARQFLKTSVSPHIPEPFVMDVFTLDVIAEMLASPLRFLSYIDRRTEYADKIAASHELTVLSYHLKQNLWMSGEYDRIMLADDISTDLDVAMTVRREHIPGERTPTGILTRIKGTAFERILMQIEFQPKPETIELGFSMLKMGGESISQFSQGVDRTMELARNDLGGHDFSLGSKDTGITVHSNFFPTHEAKVRLSAHVELRKYKERASSWFGLNIRAEDGKLMFGYNAESEWQENESMEEASKKLGSYPGITFANGKPHRKKIGRNEVCPCGSGKKFKRCHGG